MNHGWSLFDCWGLSLGFKIFISYFLEVVSLSLFSNLIVSCPSSHLFDYYLILRSFVGLGHLNMHHAWGPTVWFLLLLRPRLIKLLLVFIQTTCWNSLMKKGVLVYILWLYSLHLHLLWWKMNRFGGQSCLDAVDHCDEFLLSKSCYLNCHSSYYQLLRNS